MNIILKNNIFFFIIIHFALNHSTMFFTNLYLFSLLLKYNIFYEFCIYITIYCQEVSKYDVSPIYTYCYKLIELRLISNFN